MVRVLRENIIGNWENAGYKYFLLFPQSFQTPHFIEFLKLGNSMAKDKQEILLLSAGLILKVVDLSLTLYHTIPTFNYPK